MQKLEESKFRLSVEPARSLTQFSIRLMSRTYLIYQSHLSDRIWHSVLSLISSHSVSFQIILRSFICQTHFDIHFAILIVESRPRLWITCICLLGWLKPAKTYQVLIVEPIRPSLKQTKKPRRNSLFFGLMQSFVTLCASRQPVHTLESYPNVSSHSPTPPRLARLCAIARKSCWG